MTKQRDQVIPPALAAGIVVALIVGYFGIVALIGANIQTPQLGQAGVGLVILLLGIGYVATGPSYESFSALCLGLLGIFAILLGGTLLLAPIAGALMPDFNVPAMWAMLVLTLAVLTTSVVLVRLYRQTDDVPPTKPGFWNTVFGVIGQLWLAGYLLATAFTLPVVALLV